MIRAIVVAMASRNSTQLNIRSAFARERAREIASRTGMTVTEVVEEALRGYVPPGDLVTAPSLIRRGPLLVIPAKGQPAVTLEQANDALDAVRGRTDDPSA